MSDTAETSSQLSLRLKYLHSLTKLYLYQLQYRRLLDYKPKSYLLLTHLIRCTVFLDESPEMEKKDKFEQKVNDLKLVYRFLFSERQRNKSIKKFLKEN